MVSKSQGFLLDLPHPEDGDEHGDRAENIADVNADLAKHSVFHDDRNEENLDDADPDDLSVFDPDEELMEEKPVEKKRRIVKVSKCLSDAMMSHAKRLRMASGHQTGYKNEKGELECPTDDVEFRVEWEKMVNMARLAEQNEAFEKHGGKWGDEELPLKIKTKPIPSVLKDLAELSGADPDQMWFPRFMVNRPPKILYRLAKAIRKQVDEHPDRAKWTVVQAMLEASARWNLEVSKRKPAVLVMMKNGKQRLLAYTHLGLAWKPMDPAKLPQSGKQPNNWPYPGVVYREGSEMTAQNLKAPCSFDTAREPYSLTPMLAEEFMEKAQAGEPIPIFQRDETIKEPILDAEGNPKKGAMSPQSKIIRDENGKPKLTMRQTKCVVSGDSLVLHKTTGWRSWEIAPTLWGMNVRTARLVVDAAAVVAGLAPGQVEGAPEVVNQLATQELKEISKALNQIVEASGRSEEMNDVYTMEGSIASRGKRLGKLVMEIFEKSDAIIKDLSAQYDEYSNETQPAATPEEIEAAQAADWFVDPSNLEELGKMVVGADAWAICAVATGNTAWGPLAKKLLEYRDRHYFKLEEQDIVHNQRELKKIAAKLRTYL